MFCIEPFLNYIAKLYGKPKYGMLKPEKFSHLQKNHGVYKVSIDWANFVLNF